MSTVKSSVLAQKFVSDVVVHLPILGAKLRTNILRSQLLASPSPSTDSGTWNFWQMKVAGNETIAVLRDRRLDPYLAMWIAQTPVSRDASVGQTNRIEQLRQYVYLSFSDNTAPDTPMRDGALERLVQTRFYDSQKPSKMLYFTLGDFLKINRGICRHSALGMKVLLENEGLKTDYVTGEIRHKGKISPHAWNVVTNSLGQRFLLDTAMYLDRILPVDDETQFAVGTMNGETVEYKPIANSKGGSLRPLDRHDDPSIFFRN